MRRWRGDIAAEMPAEIPSGLRIKNARKSFLSSFKRVKADCSKKRRKLDADYLKYLSKLQEKHASNEDLIKQIAEEKAAVLKLAAEAKAAVQKDDAQEKKVARGRNAVINGDFEKVVDGWPVGWRKPYHKDMFSIVEENGNKFFRFNQKPENKDGTGNYHGLYYDKQMEVPVKTGSVQLSVKMRTVDVDAKAAKEQLRVNWPFARVVFLDKDGNDIHGFAEAC